MCCREPKVLKMGVEYQKMIPRIIPDSEARVWTRPFAPIRDWEGYLNSQRMAGATAEELEYIEACHKREYPPYPVPPPKKKEYNTNPVIIRMKVSESGVGVVVVENKFSTMLREYYSFGKQPPRKYWIEAMIQTGMDFKEVLACLVRKESRRNDRCELLDKEEPQVKKKVLKPVLKIS